MENIVMINVFSSIYNQIIMIADAIIWWIMLKTTIKTSKVPIQAWWQIAADHGPIFYAGELTLQSVGLYASATNMHN